MASSKLMHRTRRQTDPRAAKSRALQDLPQRPGNARTITGGSPTLFQYCASGKHLSEAKFP